VNALSETSKFTEDILATANEKARKIIEQAEIQKQRLLEEARSSINKEVADITLNAEAEAEAIKRREVSEIRHRAKLREQLEKDKILVEVLEETKKNVLYIVMDEDKYLAYLVKIISDAIRQLNLPTVTIHMNAEDLRRIDSTKLIREITNNVNTVAIVVSKNPISCSGGAVVSSPDNRIRIVSTFEQRFEALEPRLLIEAGRLLFTDNI
jgi:vacuolar-type H+-ATPase subunit E/Vma4